MKKLIFTFLFCLPMVLLAQVSELLSGGAVNRAGVPDEMLTSDSTWWMISTVSTMGYVNTTPGASYNTYKSGGGMIVKFKFNANGTYRFLLYIQSNSYGIDTETWTDCEGKVEFFRNGKGYQFMKTTALKGTYRVTQNGKTTTRPIPASDLRNQHSNTYICERTQLKDDQYNDYLLLVDLDAHPSATLDNPASIQPDWVSKFHIPRKQ